MADWAYRPLWDYVVGLRGPAALVTELADGSTVRRRKRDLVLRTVRERHQVTDDTLAEMMDFYAFYGIDRVFTKATFDLRDPEGYEGMFRFTGPPEYIRRFVDNNELEFEFAEELS